jgi:tyrosinase
VPLAGNDPLFYMHHSNIDRLWQCWLNEKAQGATITLQWAKDNLGMSEDWYGIGYYFANENGEKVYKTIADAFSPEVLAVSYAQEVDCQLDIDGYTSTEANKDAQAIASQLESEPVKIIAKVYSSDQVTLQPYAVDVQLQASAMQSATSKNLWQEYQSKQGIWLILDDIKVNHKPYFTFTFNVYVSNKKQADIKPVSVGVFNFFGFGSNHGHGGSDHEGVAKDSMGRQVYLISDDLSELKLNNIDDVHSSSR